MKLKTCTLTKSAYPMPDTYYAIKNQSLDHLLIKTCRFRFRSMGEIIICPNEVEWTYYSNKIS